MLKFEECKKVLNTNNENYNDDEIKLIMKFIEHWATINAKTIINKINEIKDEKSSNNGSRKQR
jgi:hypothetical protein